MWEKQMATLEAEIDTRQVDLADVRKQLDNENNTAGAVSSSCPRSNSSTLLKVLFPPFVASPIQVHHAACPRVLDTTTPNFF